MDLSKKIEIVEKQILENGYATADHLEEIGNHCNANAAFGWDDYYSLILEILGKATDREHAAIYNKKIKDLTAKDLDEVMWDLDELYFDLMDQSISKKQAANMKLGTALQKVHG
jgi:hypothetical protein